jgi:hypothetical protein
LAKASQQHWKLTPIFDNRTTGNRSKTLYHPKPLFKLSYA